MSRSELAFDIAAGRLERLVRVLAELRIPAASVGDIRFDLGGQAGRVEDVTIGSTKRRRRALRLLELRRERADGTLEVIASTGHPAVPVPLAAGENLVVVVANDNAAPATVMARARLRSTLSGR